MGIFRSLSGVLTVELTSGSLTQSLAAIAAKGIQIQDIRIQDELTARFRLKRTNYSRVRVIAQQKGDELHIVDRGGVFWDICVLFRRPILVLGFLLILSLSIFLPGRVLFVQVEGNNLVPADLILEEAANHGIHFGASGREVRSEKVKNAILGSIPQLQWAGVNTRGCVAVISVRERAAEEVIPEEVGISSIAAERDAIILSSTVHRGTGTCVPGQAVKAGDILISGYTDCGLCLTATRAEGEIEAITSRTLTVITPGIYDLRQSSGKTESNFSLIIGKKRINFSQGSGIYDVSCVKMYSEYVLTLPGGFQLPVTLVKETLQYRETSPMEVSAEETASLLKSFAQRYLSSQMRGGRIIHAAESVTDAPELRSLTGLYTCREFIGFRVQEQIGVIP